MKRRFRWWLTAILLYLFSVPTIFVLIGLFTLLVFVNGAFAGPATAYLWLYFMLFLGIPSSLLSTLYVPSIVLGAIRKRRLRRLRRARR